MITSSFTDNLTTYSESHLYKATPKFAENGSIELVLNFLFLLMSKLSANKFCESLNNLNAVYTGRIVSV